MNNAILTKLFDFLILLIQWNEKFNLISIHTLHDLFINHVVDTLSLLEFHSFQDIKICDIGTGVGFPGLILAIIKPENQYFFFEPQKKYYLFLKKAINNLDLANIVLINDKIENYQLHSIEKFDIIVNRAVGDIDYMINICSNIIREDTILFFLKGEQIFNEIARSNLIDWSILWIKRIKILEMHSKNHYIMAIKK